MDFYRILQVDENATPEQIEESYRRLKARYSEDRFKDGEEGNAASHALEELEIAYAELSSHFQKQEQGGAFASLEDVDRLIKENNLQAAQESLDNMSQRNGEWHYLQSIVYYKRGWYADCKKQLSLALSLEPHNPKYRTASDKLDQFLGNVRVESNLGPQSQQPVFETRDNQACESCCTQACCCSWMLYCCSC